MKKKEYSILLIMIEQQQKSNTPEKQMETLRSFRHSSRPEKIK